MPEVKEISNDNRIRIFVVGDTHFGHAAIIKYCGRPFKSVLPTEIPTEMDETLIRKWNEIVKPEDIVIHVGDFAFHRTYEHFTGVIKQLNGRKILVRGNHDRKSNHFYLTNGFDFVCDSFSMGKVLFTHRPVPKNEFLLMPYKVNIHGHIHDKDLYDPITHKNMSVEKINYTPIKLETIVPAKYLGGKRDEKSLS